MKLKKYIKRLQELEKKVGDVDLIYGTDEEGNWFESVCFAPSIKYVPKECLTNGSIDGIKVCDYEDKNEGADTVVVCIN
jgi:hypothetical protein